MTSRTSSGKSKPHRHVGKSEKPGQRLEVGAFLAVGGTVRTQCAQSEASCGEQKRLMSVQTALSFEDRLKTHPHPLSQHSETGRRGGV